MYFLCGAMYFLLSGHGFCEARGGDWGNREDTMRFDDWVPNAA